MPALLEITGTEIHSGEPLVLVAFLLLLFLSALYSSAEVAFFSLTPTQLGKMKEEESKYSKVLKLLELPSKEQAPKKLLATILVANNFVNVGLVLLSARVMPLIEPDALYWGGFFRIEPTFFSFLFALVLVTLVLVLFGEIIPKVYATNNNQNLAAALALPLSMTQSMLNPVTGLLIRSTGFFEKKYRNRQPEISVDDLSTALEITNSGERSDDEQKILEGIVTFGSKSVKQVMTSRMDIEALSFDLTFSELIDGILTLGYSRIPIFKTSMDEITGILYIKDVLPHIDKEEFDWHHLLRPVMVVPEGKKIDDLLKEFQGSRIHLALVVDEYGGTSGLITLEDILEEIVGDITDEFDEDQSRYSKIDENNFLVEGKMSLSDFYRVMDLDGAPFEKRKGEADSLAGFIIEVSGKIPLKGEKIRFGELLFTIESADRRKVKQIKVTRPEEANEQ